MPLLNEAKPKVFLILDNRRVYQAELVKEWLETHKSMIKFFYLPAYSLELNQDNT